MDEKTRRKGSAWIIGLVLVGGLVAMIGSLGNSNGGGGGAQVTMEPSSLPTTKPVTPTIAPSSATGGGGGTTVSKPPTYNVAVDPSRLPSLSDEKLDSFWGDNRKIYRVVDLYDGVITQVAFVDGVSYHQSAVATGPAEGNQTDVMMTLSIDNRFSGGTRIFNLETDILLEDANGRTYKPYAPKSEWHLGPGEQKADYVSFKVPATARGLNVLFPKVGIRMKLNKPLSAYGYG